MRYNTRQESIAKRTIGWRLFKHNSQMAQAHTDQRAVHHICLVKRYTLLDEWSGLARFSSQLITIHMHAPVYLRGPSPSDIVLHCKIHIRMKAFGAVLHDVLHAPWLLTSRNCTAQPTLTRSGIWSFLGWTKTFLHKLALLDLQWFQWLDVLAHERTRVSQTWIQEASWIYNICLHV